MTPCVDFEICFYKYNYQNIAFNRSVAKKIVKIEANDVNHIGIESLYQQKD